MEITWLGHACFRLRGKEGTVVTDPFGKGLGLAISRHQADVVTVSHEHSGHNNASSVGGQPRVISGPGEYEIKNIFVTGIGAFHDAKQGKEQGKVTIYLIELEDMVICHLGDLGDVPTQAQLEAIGHVDILLTPVGAGNSLNAAQAAEVVSLLEPRAVIPMHYHTSGLATALDPLARFIKEMGARSDPHRNPLHPALRLEEVEPGQPRLDMTRSAPAAVSPDPPVTWTARLRKS
jgi:L-ascorbate metabolism protein UlaG (beta-lactamase superfamily)